LKKPILKSYVNIKMLKRSRLFKGLPREILGWKNHRHQVIKIPEEFELAATSGKTRVEALFHKKKNIFGLQFHPEKGGGVGDIIFDNFLSLCKK